MRRLGLSVAKKVLKGVSSLFFPDELLEGDGGEKGVDRDGCIVIQRIPNKI